MVKPLEIVIFHLCYGHNLKKKKGRGFGKGNKKKARRRKNSEHIRDVAGWNLNYSTFVKDG